MVLAFDIGCESNLSYTPLPLFFVLIDSLSKAGTPQKVTHTHTLSLLFKSYSSSSWCHNTEWLRYIRCTDTKENRDKPQW